VRFRLRASYPTSTSSIRETEKRGVSGAKERGLTHRDLSARISVGRVPQAQGTPNSLAGEAQALVTLAALREAIPAERARTFAAAVLAESDVAQWALAVLRGEPHAARALVELANVLLQLETIGTKLPNTRRPTPTR